MIAENMRLFIALRRRMGKIELNIIQRISVWLKTPGLRRFMHFVYTHDVTDDILKKEVIESAIEEEVDFIST